MPEIEKFFWLWNLFLTDTFEKTETFWDNFFHCFPNPNLILTFPEISISTVSDGISVGFGCISETKTENLY